MFSNNYFGNINYHHVIENPRINLDDVDFCDVEEGFLCNKKIPVSHPPQIINANQQLCCKV